MAETAGGGTVNVVNVVVDGCAVLVAGAIGREKNSIYGDRVGCFFYYFSFSSVT